MGVQIFLYIGLMIAFGSSLSIAATGKYLSRNRASNLLLPPEAITFSAFVSKRSECLALLAPYADGCCTIYDSATSKCTIVRANRFQLIENASESLEVGIDSGL